MDEHKSESKTEAKIESTQKKVEFSDIIKIELGEIKGQIKFILESGTIITENIESCSKFVDPSYDSVFKAIFEDGNVLERIDGNKRLLNLLNSLIFPNETSKCFTEIQSISNEKSKITQNQNNSGIMRFDISCRAKVSDKKEKTTKIIEVEMQLGKKTDILSRMDKYANSLYQIYNLETILIAFMNHNYINEENRTQFSIKIVFDGKGKILKEQHNVEVIIVNLKEEIENNQKKEKICINKKELNKFGIRWLKLLGIRQWGKTINNFYYLPKNIHFLSKELETTFKLLQTFDEGELARLLRKEEDDNNILKVHEEIGEKKGEEIGIKKGKMMQILGSLLNCFEKKKKYFDEMINIIDCEQSEFKIKDIEEMIPEETKREEFLQLLRKKRKIE